MRVVILGGSGHIGSWLTPRVVEAGHTAVCVSRSRREPYLAHDAWGSVERVAIDRVEAEAQGSFGPSVLALRPDAVIDLTCYTLESARHLAEALRGRVEHFLHCGTIWVHGMAIEVPISEEVARRPISDYGRRKADIETYLLHQHAEFGFPATILHPGHLVGPGWVPLNPAGNFDPEVFAAIASGKEILLPNLGRETLHHVHCDDVAQAFVRAMENRSRAVGESFHVVSSKALTLAGYAESVASWFGREAKICFLPWEEFRSRVPAKDANVTWDHIARSPNCSIEKAVRLLGYAPGYSSLEAIRESLSWLCAHGTLSALTSFKLP
ncbi:MAG: NAD-dependent epimerase/dehydratase [Bryobacterales bacterium]|nr:NAD-dependent epimerase/dehydratase [Bryobacterales bacterium]